VIALDTQSRDSCAASAISRSPGSVPDRIAQMINKSGYGTLVDVPTGISERLVEELEHLSGYPLMLFPAKGNIIRAVKGSG